MENFKVNDKVLIIGKKWLCKNNFKGPQEGIVTSLNAYNFFFKEEHGSVELKDKRSFVVFPRDCELVSSISFKLEQTDDPVNHPSHYTFEKFEVLDVLQDWFPTQPLLWQVVKYIARADHKGNKLQDLQKAEFYLKKAIEMESSKETR
jgi:Protein of unknwon function (DUF3310)